MTENLTESFQLWPWAPWMTLAALCFAASLFRRDHWAEIPLVGCLIAASVGALAPHTTPLQFLAFGVGSLVAVLLVRPWLPDEDVGADATHH